MKEYIAKRAPYKLGISRKLLPVFTADILYQSIHATVRIVKYHMRGIGTESLHIEVQKIVHKHVRYPVITPKHGIYKGGQKQAVYIFKRASVKRAIAVHASVIYQKIVTRYKNIGFTVKRVLCFSVYKLR